MREISGTAATESNAIATLLREFRAKAEPLGVVVDRVAAVAAASRAIAEWAMSLDAHRVVVAPQLSDAVPGVFAELMASGLDAETARSPHETRDAPLGVSLAHLAIAETGSLLLDERELPDRSVSMLTLANAIICPTSALVANLDDAAQALLARALVPGGSFVTLVTGPSRTADIERVLTVGVQGPGRMLALFVDEL
jgi:L-lactate dehydrogenase complex protein LldG